MKKTTMVRYKVRPEEAALNQQLIEAVFEELQRTRPAGLEYQSFRMDDGVSFVHVSVTEAGQPSPLQAVEAFKAFLSDIRARCEEPPANVEVLRIGRYAAQV
ncbi:hypothetical protein [Ramlibacter sp.]|uniref:hypothetical protein n=1 Tax=Ramlibacter sp. TaxID=1917967 RepID=UPI0017DC45E6|nr:hypothetical protein [Ramlibacter sp.]MBA2674507.1 hypothetical protein [Ramlibacter sp.]